MDAQKINDKWKELSEQIPVPDSLTPEQIEKMLRQKRNERRARRAGRLANRLAVVAAACLLLLLAANSLGITLIPSMKDDTSELVCSFDTSPETPAEGSSGTAEDSSGTVEKTTPHTSYAQLQKTISEYLDTVSYGSCEDFAAEAEAFNDTDAAAGSARLYEGSASTGSQMKQKSEDTSHTKTDLQVQGVDEGDIVKTDGTYIYSCSDNAGGSVIHIYRADGEDTKKVSKITLDERSVSEMYVDSDRLVAVGTYWGHDGDDSDSESFPFSYPKDDMYYSDTTRISVYDISDAQNPKCLSEKKQSGSYYTSRKNGDYLYTLSKMYVYSVEKNGDEKTYIPCADGKLLPEDRLYLPEHVVSNSYLVLTALDVTKGDAFTDTLSVLGAGSEDICYVSEENIFVATGFYDYTPKTTISKYSYHDGKLKALSERTFNGTLHDQFSMDEYNGQLRFVATTYHSYSLTTDSSTTNGLYILDENLKMMGSVDNLAKNERIYSARFLGSRAYFVTYRETDPVFFADLSDPNNPVIKDKLKIPGFSEYLHTFGEGLLLGIGSNQMKDGSMQVKFSMFDISTDTSVTEKNKKLLEKDTESLAGRDHKTVLVDTERNRIGLCIGSEKDLDHNDYYSSYRIYSYDKKGFHKVAKLHPKGLDISARGLFIGSCFYLVNDITGGPGICVYDADTFERLK